MYIQTQFRMINHNHTTAARQHSGAYRHSWRRSVLIHITLTSVRSRRHTWHHHHQPYPPSSQYRPHMMPRISEEDGESSSSDSASDIPASPFAPPSSHSQSPVAQSPRSRRFSLPSPPVEDADADFSCASIQSHQPPPAMDPPQPQPTQHGLGHRRPSAAAQPPRRYFLSLDEDADASAQGPGATTTNADDDRGFDLARPPPTAATTSATAAAHSSKDRRGFRPGSIFYEPPPASSTGTAAPESNNGGGSTRTTPSKNSIFFEDFSVLPSSKFAMPPLSLDPIRIATTASASGGPAGGARSAVSSVLSAGLSTPDTPSSAMPVTAGGNASVMDRHHHHPHLLQQQQHRRHDSQPFVPGLMVPTATELTADSSMSVDIGGHTDKAVFRSPVEEGGGVSAQQAALASFATSGSISVVGDRQHHRKNSRRQSHNNNNQQHQQPESIGDLVAARLLPTHPQRAPLFLHPQLLRRQSGPSSSSSSLTSPTQQQSDAGHSPKSPITTATFDNELSSVNVFYMPIKKNLLGMGRFSDVYRGTYSVPEHHAQAFGTIVEDVATPVSPTVQQKLGAGGGQLLRTCAVKCLHKYEDAQVNGWTEASVVSLFQRSGSADDSNQASASSASEHLLQLLSVDVDVGLNVSLVYEYCPNGNLWDFLRRTPEQCGLRAWIQWCRQLADVVGFMHRRRACRDFFPGHNVDAAAAENDDDFILIHNDIKPQNILLNRQLTLKLSDFGSAAVLFCAHGSDTDQQTLDGGLGRGTQAYSAPESLSAPRFLFSTASDIYSLGCTYYALLTGREPFVDIRSPVQQLFAIRKGFMESGANPFHRQALLNHSCQFNLFASSDRINLEPVAQKQTAQQYIVDMIAACTAVNPAKRPKIADLCRRLADIDDLLVAHPW